MKNILLALFVLLTLGAFAIAYFAHLYEEGEKRIGEQVQGGLNKLQKAGELKSKFVIADGIAISAKEIAGKKYYIDALDKALQELEIKPVGNPLSDEFGISLHKLVAQSSISTEEKKNVLTVQSKILQLGAETKSLKNDQIMQSILGFLEQIKTNDELILLIQLNEKINDHALNMGEPTNEWICRLTRSTIWLCAIKAGFVRGEKGVEILKIARSALSPLSGSETKDFVDLEARQEKL